MSKLDRWIILGMSITSAIGVWLDKMDCAIFIALLINGMYLNHIAENIGKSSK